MDAFDIIKVTISSIAIFLNVVTGAVINIMPRTTSQKFHLNLSVACFMYAVATLFSVTKHCYIAVSLWSSSVLVIPLLLTCVTGSYVIALYSPILLERLKRYDCLMIIISWTIGALRALLYISLKGVKLVKDDKIPDSDLDNSTRKSIHETCSVQFPGPDKMWKMIFLKYLSLIIPLMILIIISVVLLIKVLRVYKFSNSIGVNVPGLWQLIEQLLVLSTAVIICYLPMIGIYIYLIAEEICSKMTCPEFGDFVGAKTWRYLTFLKIVSGMLVPIIQPLVLLCNKKIREYAYMYTILVFDTPSEIV